MTDTVPPVGGRPEDRPAAHTRPSTSEGPTEQSSAGPSSADEAAAPRYRLITGPDDAELSQRVSDALAEGYELHGSPAITTRHGELMVAQALVLSL